VAKPVAAGVRADVRAVSRRCSHTPSPMRAAPRSAPPSSRIGGENQPRDAASNSSVTTPSRVTTPPTQASSRAPDSAPERGEVRGPGAAGAGPAGTRIGGPGWPGPGYMPAGRGPAAYGLPAYGPFGYGPPGRAPARRPGNGGPGRGPLTCGACSDATPSETGSRSEATRAPARTSSLRDHGSASTSGPGPAGPAGPDRSASSSAPMPSSRRPIRPTRRREPRTGQRAQAMCSYRRGWRPEAPLGMSTITPYRSRLDHVSTHQGFVGDHPHPLQQVVVDPDERTCLEVV